MGTYFSKEFMNAVTFLSGGRTYQSHMADYTCLQVKTDDPNNHLWGCPDKPDIDPRIYILLRNYVRWIAKPGYSTKHFTNVAPLRAMIGKHLSVYLTKNQTYELMLSIRHSRNTFYYPPKLIEGCLLISYILIPDHIRIYENNRTIPYCHYDALNKRLAFNNECGDPSRMLSDSMKGQFDISGIDGVPEGWDDLVDKKRYKLKRWDDLVDGKRYEY